MSAPNTPARVTVFRRKKALWWIIAALVLAVLGTASHIFSGQKNANDQNSQTSGTVQSKSQTKVVLKVIRVKLHPSDWSEWISIAELKPPEVPDNARFKFQINTPGWHEYKLWTDPNGEPIRVPDKSENEEESKKWLKDIAGSTFKLRGKEGEAIIRIEYFFETKTP